MKDWKHRKAVDAEPAWWLSEAGIRGKYASEREAAVRQHEERMARIAEEEAQALDAFRKAKL